MDLSTLRHSCSHVLAEAVKELWPQTKLGIGPSIEDGFYYDFDKAEPFVDADLARIEEKMREIIARDEPFVREDLPKADAAALFEKERYKVALLGEIPDATVSVYRTGAQFLDLCRGPHIESTGKIRAFKLLSVAGAYWKGDEKNPMLQRVYGTAFDSREDLERYLKMLEEAKARDHRKLGRELDLFSIEEDWGPGLVFWHPKGAMLRKVIEDFWREEHLRNGYEFVNIPHLGRAELWKRSGHLEFYKDYMYAPMDVEKDKYIVKPMNCPGHILIYKSQTRSYRDLPVRFAELGTVYRYEKSGVLHGLMRVRGFTQDDAHIFCDTERLEEEIVGVLRLTFSMLGAFGFRSYDIYLSTMPEKHVGDDGMWKLATAALENALKKERREFVIDPGEGVFYGPKIDIKIKDAIGRAWQCSTIQVDFNLPERFALEFVSSDGSVKPPIMIHRALLGSLERFLGILIEHYAGAFPVWLAPVQAVIIPISEKNLGYARDFQGLLSGAHIRTNIDARNEKMQKKIRDAEIAKVPYMLVVGQKEQEAMTVSVRSKAKGDLGSMRREAFVETISREAREKT